MIDFANVLDSSQTTTDACTPVSEHSKFCRCCHKTYFTSRISALKKSGIPHPASILSLISHPASRIPQNLCWTLHEFRFVLRGLAFTVVLP